MAYSNPYGLVGYNELSPYVKRLLDKVAAGNIGGGGSGGGGGTTPDPGGGGTGGTTTIISKSIVYTERSYQIIKNNTNKVKINLNTYNPQTDDVLIFQNGAFMTLGLEYTLNNDKSISPVSDIWRASEAQPMIFDFYCIGNVTQKDSTLKYVLIHVLSSDSGWVQEGDLWTKLVAHNLGSENIIVTGIYNDNRRSMQEVYDIIDENTIKIYNEEPITVDLSIVDVVGSKSGPNATSGISMTVSASDFTLDESVNMYKAELNHALNTENILVSIRDANNRSVYLSFYTIDKDNIYIYNTKAENLTLSILPL